MGTKELYSKLKELTFKILENYDNIANREVRRRVIIKYFVKVLLLHSLYDIISKQFDGNQFQIIPESAILTNIEFLPSWIKRIRNEVRLKVELYGIPSPQPPSGDKPDGGQPPDGAGGQPPDGDGGQPPRRPAFLPEPENDEDFDDAQSVATDGATQGNVGVFGNSTILQENQNRNHQQPKEGRREST